MELTENFNAASQGDAGTASFGGGPDTPIPGTPGHAKSETQASETAPIRATEGAVRAGLSWNFNAAADPDEPTEQDAPAQGRGLSAAEAHAELEILEAGRPAPVLNDEFKPPRRIARLVNSEIELKRESRIAGLKAFLATHSEPDPEREYEVGCHLGPGF